MHDSRSFDLSTIDLDGFLGELTELRREIDASIGEEDLRHLRKVERWGRACTALGLLTAGIAPNPLSPALLGLGRAARWLLMHHVAHRGYDKVPGVPARFTSKVFARGRRRFLDWADWMTPEAWVYTHNVRHHSFTGEARDPDMVDVGVAMLRPLPRPLRYALLGIMATNWRPTSYTPQSVRTWLSRRESRESHAEKPVFPPVNPKGHFRELWLRCYLPCATFQFGLLPLAYLPLGPWAVFSAFCNSLMAEVFYNLHTFVVVAPNHAGDDLYCFDDRPASRAEHAVRQIVSSTNYATRGDLHAFFHLWLNYQIEHHLWPDIPMRQYGLVQPKVRALCAKYGIPYAQQSVFSRLRKMIAVIVGNAEMPRGVIRKHATG
ncbi:fatty acid desaturase [Pendulispora brunnea]|uniref:Fatty acid desaturase n=1 Tax=Pendulispora brunnea TaxID=2905690 RepID=A0ABZ2K1J0_9BACT